MAIDQYSGGPMAGIARAITGVGEGYEHGLELIAQRKAQAQDLTDKQNSQKMAIAQLMAQSATEFPTASESDRATVVYGRLGLPVPDQYKAVPPPASTGPSMLAGPQSRVGAPTLTPPVFPPYKPVPQPVPQSQNMPRAITAPSSDPVPPAIVVPPVPPAPVQPQDPVNPPLAPIIDAISANMPVPPPSAKFNGSIMGGAVGPAPVPDPVPAPVPVMSQAQGSDPNPYVKPVVPPMPTFAPIYPQGVPAPVPPPTDLLHKQSPLGQTAQERIWGVRSAPQVERADAYRDKVQADIQLGTAKLGEKATSDMWLRAQAYSQDPNAQAEIFHSMVTQATGDPNAAIPVPTGPSDRAIHQNNQDTNAAKRTDIYGTRVNAENSVSDETVKRMVAQTGHITNADMIATIGKVGTMPPNEQVDAITAYNNDHPENTIPVPGTKMADGSKVPYFTPTSDVQSMMDLRDAEAKNVGVKSEYYPQYIDSLMAKNKSEAESVTKDAQTSALYHEALTQQMGATDDLKKLSLSALMADTQYNANFRRESFANAEIDRIDAQDRLAGYDLASGKLHTTDYNRIINNNNMRRAQLNSDISTAQEKRTQIESRMQSATSAPAPSGPSGGNTQQRNGNSPPQGFVPVPNGKGAYVNPATKTYWYNGITVSINK